MVWWVDMLSGMFEPLNYYYDKYIKENGPNKL